MRIIVIGGVAAGTSAAAKARRNAPAADIVIYEKGEYISYATCGLPYYIGGQIEDIGVIAPRDSAYFKQKYGIEVKTGHEVTAIDTAGKTVTVRADGKTFEDRYDKLVIATGANAFRPDIRGIERPHVFFLRSINDAEAIRDFIVKNKPKSAVIAGSGAIGLEMVTNLPGTDVNVVELMDQIVPSLDSDMAGVLEEKLRQRGVKMHTSRRIESINETGVTLDGGQTLDAEIVVMATGVRPNTALAKSAGIALGVKDAIRVDKHMQTSAADVYACGDCAETFSAITGKPAYFPLGSTANKTGRITGDAITGGSLAYRGSLGTGIFKALDMTVGLTGLTEKQALAQGYDIIVSNDKKTDKLQYFGGQEMEIKAVADKNTGRLLGAQIVGQAGVDKRIDVFATLITFGAAAEDIFHLDLSYAPQFSMAKGPVHYTGMILTGMVKKRNDK